MLAAAAPERCACGSDCENPEARLKRRLDVELLRSSFDTARRRDPDFMSHFYERLFTAHPEVRGLFPKHMEHQETAFEQMLVQILDHLGDGEWLQLHLFALGTRHAHLYHVPREAFAWVGSALIATLAAAIPGWDENHLQAWTEAYEAIVARVLIFYPVSGVLGSQRD